MQWACSYYFHYFQSPGFGGYRCPNVTVGRPPPALHPGACNAKGGQPTIFVRVDGGNPSTATAVDICESEMRRYVDQFNPIEKKKLGEKKGGGGRDERIGPRVEEAAREGEPLA